MWMCFKQLQLHLKFNYSSYCPYFIHVFKCDFALASLWSHKMFLSASQYSPIVFAQCFPTDTSPFVYCIWCIYYCNSTTCVVLPHFSATTPTHNSNTTPSAKLYLQPYSPTMQKLSSAHITSYYDTTSCATMPHYYLCNHTTPPLQSPNVSIIFI